MRLSSNEPLRTLRNSRFADLERFLLRSSDAVHIRRPYEIHCKQLRQGCLRGRIECDYARVSILRERLQAARKADIEGEDKRETERERERESERLPSLSRVTVTHSVTFDVPA